MSRYRYLCVNLSLCFTEHDDAPNSLSNVSQGAISLRFKYSVQGFYRPSSRRWRTYVRSPPVLPCSKSVLAVFFRANHLELDHLCSTRSKHTLYTFGQEAILKGPSVPDFRCIPAPRTKIMYEVLLMALHPIAYLGLVTFVSSNWILVMGRYLLLRPTLPCFSSPAKLFREAVGST